MQTQTSKNKYWTPKDVVRKKYQTNWSKKRISNKFSERQFNSCAEPEKLRDSCQMFVKRE